MSQRHARTTRHLVAALVCAAVATGGCTSPESDGSSVEVLATTTVWADVVSEVACGEVEVGSLVPAGTDTHSFEPSVRDADLLRAAALVVANGMGLEDGLTDALRTAASDGVPVVEVVDHVEALAAEAEEGDSDGRGTHDPDTHDHDGVDPHFWMDPDLVAAAAPALAGELADAGVGPGADRLDRCASDYADRLAELGAEVDAMFEEVPVGDRAVVTHHENLGHFAERFGLEVVGSVVASTSSLAETGPRALDELEATMRERGVRAVLVDAGSRSATAERLAERVGATVVELHVESLAADGEPSSYEELIRHDARLIADALTGEGR